MAQQLIDIGDKPNDGQGDPARVVFEKVNNNFTDLYTNKAEVQHIPVTTTQTVLTDADLVVGMNIIGVNYDGISTIFLPIGLASNKMIVVNDESGNASTNNIKIRVGEPTLFTPQNFQIDAVRSTEIDVSWDVPERGTAVGYKIFYGTVASRVVTWAIGNSTTIPALTPDTEYTMYIVTYDVTGNSPPSNTDTATTLI